MQPQRRAEQGDRRRLIVVGLGLALLLFFLLSPWPLDAKLRRVGFACCAQAPARTLRIGGSLMPLDARDAGIYLALLLGLALAYVVGRGRAGRWPAGNVSLLLVGLIAAMVLDGINSSFQTRGLHALYHTTNALRVITGAAAGMSLAILGLPLVNRLIWRAPQDEPVAADYTELAGFALATAILIALLLRPPAWLYYPLSILAIVGVLIGWGLVSAVIVAVATRREQRTTTRADGALLLLAGVVLSLCEIWVVGALRGATS